MTFRTLLVMTALLVPLVGLAADPKEKPADLTVMVKLGKTKSVIVEGAKEVRSFEKGIADVSIGEPNQVMLEGLSEGETSALVVRKGEPPFKLAIQVVR